MRTALIPGEQNTTQRWVQSSFPLWAQLQPHTPCTDSSPRWPIPPARRGQPENSAVGTGLKLTLVTETTSVQLSPTPGGHRPNPLVDTAPTITVATATTVALGTVP